MSKALEQLKSIRGQGCGEKVDPIDLTSDNPDPAVEHHQGHLKDHHYRGPDGEISGVNDSPAGSVCKRERKRASLEASSPPRAKRQSVKKSQTLIEVLKRTPIRDLPPAPDPKKESSDALLAEILNEMEIRSQPPTPKMDEAGSTPASPLNALTLDEVHDPEMDCHPEQAVADIGQMAELELSCDGVLPFFFLDAEETVHVPGVVYLFGRVPWKGKHVSCCVQVHDVIRTLYFVPSDDIFRDVAALEKQFCGLELLKHLHELANPLKGEIYDLLRSRGIQKNISIKPVKRNYAFDDIRIAHGDQYVLKVKFLDRGVYFSNAMTGQHYQVVLGGKQSLIESLLLRRKIKGPSWIGIKDPVEVEMSKHRSWCLLEVEIGSHKNIITSSTEDWIKRAPPGLKIVSLSLKTQMNAKSRDQEIVMANLLALDHVKIEEPMSREEWSDPKSLYYVTCVMKYNKQPWPPGFVKCVNKMDQRRQSRISLAENERNLLDFLLVKMIELDPDVIVGHNIASWDLTILLQRMQKNKSENWSRIGRLKRARYPTNVSGLMPGRLLCDIHIQAKEMIKEIDYTLTTLSKSLLGMTRKEISFLEHVQEAQGLQQWLLQGENDVWLALGILFHLSILPLTKQLTNLSGSLWNRTIQGQRAQRIEMLLLHEFHDRKFLLPEKLDVSKEVRGEENRKGKGPQYAGGLVLEPKKGLYDKLVLLLDFNSLYPTIIQEYNICFTTVDRTEKTNAVPSGESAASKSAPLPVLIKDLVQRRRQVKSSMNLAKDSIQRQQLDIRQQALKLTANSMYGCLGFANSRFYCKQLAELITQQGRDILQNTVDFVQNELHLEVIYGDTDSIMVNTGKEDYYEVMKMGAIVRKAINKRYKLLEMDTDGIYRSLLLLKKKKYAAMKITAFNEGVLVEEIEEKGLDTVRRDWSSIAKEAGSIVLKEILSGKPKEEVVLAIHEYLRNLRERIQTGILPIHQFIIVKQLAKKPEDYPDAKIQPHVQVAIRRKQQGKQDAILPGDTIPYIICIKEDGKSLADRAFHPEEVEDPQLNLRIDEEYYLASQIHPVVSRLCGPIEGTDEARLAECLGLQGSKYKQMSISGDQMECTEAALVSSYGVLHDSTLEPLILQWNGVSFEFGGVDAVLEDRVLAKDVLGPVEQWKNFNARLTPAQLANQVVLQARKYIVEYYDAWCESEEDDRHVTQVPIYAEGAEQGLKKWKRVISERKLYLQLAHWVKQLDVDSAVARISNPKAKVDALEKLKDLKEQFRLAFIALKQIKEQSQFGSVNLCTLLAVKRGRCAHRL